MREPGQLTRELADEAATRAAGAALARALAGLPAETVMVTLSGDLGAGKTTFARGFLEALGARAPIRSPTYTLIESYPLDTRTVHHLDWYRLGAGADLEGIGYRDLAGPGQWLLVEWPERVPEVAALADLAVTLEYRPAGRGLRVHALTPLGHSAIAATKTAKALE